MENSTQSNSNKQSNYGDLGLQELKDLARKREIIPEGNKSFKDTWKAALEQDDQLKAVANNNPSEVTTNISDQSQTTISSDEQQPDDQISLDNSADDQGIIPPVTPDSDEQQPDDQISLDNSADDQGIIPPVIPDSDEQQPDDQISLDNSANNQDINSQIPSAPDNQQQINDSLSFENPSTEARDYVLDNIVTPLDQRRVDVDRLEVNLDGRNIFKMRDGDVANSQVTDSQAELIKQALNDPASFEGTVKITNGKQVLLHVKDGQVLRDGLNLTKQTTKIEISSSTNDLYEKYSQNLSNNGSLKTTKQVAKNALSDGISNEQVKDIIKSQDPGYKNLAASSNETVANNSLNKIVASASAEIKNSNSRINSEEIKKTPALSR